MPLEDIIAKIKSEARAKSEALLASAEEERKKVLDLAERDAEAEAKKILEEAQKEAAILVSMAESRAKAHVRQALLQEKGRLLSATFERALEELRAMPGPEYKAFLLKAVSRFARGDEELVLGRDDAERLGERFSDELRAALKEAGRMAEVKVKYDEVTYGGGFRLVTEGVCNNLTFRAVLGLLCDELEIQVAKTLFPGGAST